MQPGKANGRTRHWGIELHNEPFRLTVGVAKFIIVARGISRDPEANGTAIAGNISRSAIGIEGLDGESLSASLRVCTGDGCGAHARGAHIDGDDGRIGHRGHIEGEGAGRDSELTGLIAYRKGQGAVVVATGVVRRRERQVVKVGQGNDLASGDRGAVQLQRACTR
ncbi:hypothetical protein D3C85_1323390 [compost metagenome]